MSGLLGLGGYGSDHSGNEASVGAVEAEEKQEEEPEADEIEEEKVVDIIDPQYNELCPANDASEEAAPALRQKLMDYIQLMSSSGIDFTTNVKSKKDYGNPGVLTLICNHYNVNPKGSNYPSELFTPVGLDLSDYYDVIATECRKRHREKESGHTQVLLSHQLTCPQSCQHNSSKLLLISQACLLARSLAGCSMAMLIHQAPPAKAAANGAKPSEPKRSRTMQPPAQQEQGVGAAALAKAKAQAKLAATAAAQAVAARLSQQSR
ncbi:unnamed protein product [Chrysoparadoxa australica]